jgi:hypothetical protein
VTCWDLIDTIAMMGSPASRGAVASVGAPLSPRRPAIRAISAAIAASVTLAGGPQLRIAAVDCAGISNPTHRTVMLLRCGRMPG